MVTLRSPKEFGLCTVALPVVRPVASRKIIRVSPKLFGLSAVAVPTTEPFESRKTVLVSPKLFGFCTVAVLVLLGVCAMQTLDKIKNRIFFILFSGINIFR